MSADTTPVSSPVIVSHSEVESFLNCEKKHYYAFGERLAKPPTEGSLNAMEKGTLGHAVMEAFFRARQDGQSYDDAKKAALERVRSELFNGTTPDFAAIQRIEQVTQRFLTDMRERVEGWEPVHIEQTFFLDLGDIKYPFKPDLVMRENGILTIVDYKFVGIMYNKDLIALFPQLPKYMGALRAVGVDVRKAAYLFFSTNANTKPLSAPIDSVCRISEVSINNDRLKNSWFEQIAITHRIAEKKQMPLSEWERSAIRSTGKDCSWCSFRDLCTATLQGSDGRIMRETDFVTSTYGYSENITATTEEN